MLCICCKFFQFCLCDNWSTSSFINSSYILVIQLDGCNLVSTEVEVIWIVKIYCNLLTCKYQ